MLVDFSPWESIETSLGVSKGAKRIRKNHCQTSETDAHHYNNEFVVASVVPPVRRSMKRKKTGESSSQNELTPCLALTSSHRVCVLGRNERGEHSFEESSQWQYSSRPGKSTGFFKEALVNGNSKKCFHLPSIPAVLDFKNNWVFALQNDNLTLCSWDATRATGPADASASKIRLKSAAVSLSVHTLNKGMVYGTCMNGCVFVAKWKHDREGRPKALEVQYLGTETGDHHVSTVAVSKESNSYRNAGQKRKTRDEKEESVVMHQIFLSEKRQLRVRQHEIENSESKSDNGSSALYRVLGQNQEAVIDLGMEILHETAIQGVKMDDSTISLVWRSSTDVGEWSCCCAQLSLEKGRFKRPPFPLPLHYGNACAISPSILAVSTDNRDILLFDTSIGTLMQAFSVREIIQNADKWFMVGDRKSRHISLLSHERGVIRASIATLRFRGQGEKHKNTAQTLRLSLAAPSELIEPRRTIVKEFLNHPKSWNRLMHLDEKHLRRRLANEAMIRFKTCQHTILSPSTREHEPPFFMKEFEKAATTVLPNFEPSAETIVKNSHVSQLHNPQDAGQPSKSKEARHGNLGSPKAVKDLKAQLSPCNLEKGLINGLKTTHTGTASEPVKAELAFAPELLPQHFVDDALPVVLSTLQLPYVEDRIIGQRIQAARFGARTVLWKLLRSEKISARRHFETNADEPGLSFFLSILRSLKMKRKRTRVFSPIDFMHEVLTHCSDVSEKLMVIMLNYVLCRALPEDIAETFLDYRSSDHPDSVVSKRFFNIRTRLGKTVAMMKTGKQSAELEKERAGLKQELDEVSNKVIVAGATFLVSRFASYSRCNEALLRRGLVDHLDGGSGPRVLGSILVNLLNREVTSFGARDSNPRCVNLVQWTAALFDAFYIQGSPLKSFQVKDTLPLQSVLAAVDSVVEQCKLISSLNDACEEATEDLNANDVIQTSFTRDEQSDDVAASVEDSPKAVELPVSIMEDNPSEDSDAEFMDLDEEDEEDETPHYTIEQIVW